jgi:hypothetical protein
MHDFLLIRAAYSAHQTVSTISALVSVKSYVIAVFQIQAEIFNSTYVCRKLDVRYIHGKRACRVYRSKGIKRSR